MNCVLVHCRYHANSEYVSYTEADRKGAQFTSNKHIHIQMLSFTY